MSTWFLFDRVFARSAIRKDSGSQLAGQRSAAFVFRRAKMPPYPAGLRHRADAGCGSHPHHNDASGHKRRDIGKISTKKFINICELLLFLILYVALMGSMLSYGFPFMVG